MAAGANRLTLGFIVGLALIGSACGTPIARAPPPEVIVVPPDDDAGHRADAGEPDAGGRDAGCANPCGAECCGDRERCVGGQCQCEPQCDGLHCFDDGCGGTCSCPAGAQCDLGSRECRCEQLDWQLCDSLYDWPACGVLDAIDACGYLRHVHCGTCRWGPCDPTTHECPAEPAESDDELCLRLHALCGPIDTVDNLGMPRHVESCGGCAELQACVNGRCACAPETDEELCLAAGKECGAVYRTDRCGTARTVRECGPCPSSGVCDAGACRCVPEGDADLCGANGRECGVFDAADRCGNPRHIASCGTCTWPLFCLPWDGTCFVDIIPESDDVLCQNTNVQCGPLDAVDNAGNPRHVASCGTCSAPAPACDQGHCVCVVESDPDFCTRLHQCGSVTGADNCGVSRTVAACACGAQELCYPGGQCVSMSPPNDVCSAASTAALTFDTTTTPWTATISGITTWAADDIASQYCGGAGVGDVFFEMTLSNPLPSFFDVVVTVTPASGAAFSPVVSLWDGCAPTGTELACAAASVAGPATFHASPLRSGTYIIAVDGVAAVDVGPFTLSVTAQPTGPGSPLDPCLNATALPLVAGEGQVMGATGTTTDNFSGACGMMIGPDNMYAITLPQPSIVEASLQRSASTSGWLPALYVRDTCVGSGDIACAVGVSGTASVRTPPLAPGTYFVVVDSFSFIVGEYTLTVNAGTVPTNDACATPTTLNFNASGQAIVPFDTRWAVDDSTGSCGNLTGPEIVFKATVPPHQHLWISATRDASDPNYQPAVYLQPDCATAMSRSYCALPDATGTAEVASDPCECASPGDFLIFVDGAAGTSGRGQLTASLETGMRIGRCSSLCCSKDATELTLPVSGTVMATDSTQGLNADWYGSCASAGSEVQFRFDLAIERKVEIAVTPDTGSTASHSVYVTHGRCDVAGSDLGCAVASTAGSPVTLVLSRLAAGTYVVTVDGATAADSGPFTLSVTTSAP